jgi:hypothetical protein
VYSVLVGGIIQVQELSFACLLRWTAEMVCRKLPWYDGLPGHKYSVGVLSTPTDRRVAGGSTGAHLLTWSATHWLHLLYGRPGAQHQSRSLWGACAGDRGSCPVWHTRVAAKFTEFNCGS